MNEKMTLDTIKADLIAAGIGADEARFDALALVSRFTGRSTASVLASRGEECGSPELAAAVAERMKRVPLGYITGEREFMGLTFAVTCELGRTLIPRPETELIAERLIEGLPRGGTFLDLCCGSGCIAVSVCRRRPDVSAAAVDIDPAAVFLTRKNAADNGVGSIEATLGDVRDVKLFAGRSFDMICANPPYLSAADMRELPPELKHEPPKALYGGGDTDYGTIENIANSGVTDDGMAIIRDILRLYPARLKKGGELLIEIGANQGEATLKEAKANNLTAKIIKDYAGKDRIVVSS